MPFDVEYNSDIHCLVNNLSGNLDVKLIGEYFTEVGKAANYHQCSKILTDAREAKIVAPLSQLYNMVKSLDKMQVKRTFKRAIVISRDRENFSFLETISVNQGYPSLKVFKNYEKAKIWLLKE